MYCKNYLNFILIFIGDTPCSDGTRGGRREAKALIKLLKDYVILWLKTVSPISAATLLSDSSVARLDTSITER